MGMITKNAQQCCRGTRQILKLEVSNYYIKQKKCICMHLYGYVNILDLSTGLIQLLTILTYNSKFSIQTYISDYISIRTVFIIFTMSSNLQLVEYDVQQWVKCLSKWKKL